MNPSEARNKVMALDSKLKDLFEQIGKKFYEEKRSEDLDDSTYQDLFTAVKKVYEEKNLIERKNLAMKGMRRCEACQAIVTIDSNFCNKCGAKLPELPADLLELEEKQETPKVRKCSDCGTELEPEAVFCINCGKRY